MEVALVPGNHLGHIPEELLLDIIKQPCLSDLDLISFALTNRRHYRVAISPAYKAHIEQSHGLAIYWAIKNKRQRTLELLIENGMNPHMDFGSDDGHPPLDELGTAMDGLKFTKAYMPKAINFEQNIWATPLACAVIHGRNSMVRYLLDKGADLEGMSFGLCNCSHCMLRFSSLAGSTVPPRLNFEKNPWREAGEWIPLHYAICKGHASTAKLLLARGADAEDVGGGVPALFVATRFGRNEIVDYLIANSAADINAEGVTGLTALHVAFAARKFDLVDKYLEQGADIDSSCYGSNGPWTIFLMACAEGFFERALQYLQKGANARLIIEEFVRGSVVGQFTALRLIWQHKMDADDVRSGRLASAMALEKEIIARSKTDPSFNEESE
ncbi:hypothetical protein KVR01_009230 [Diaporthe batatas]|uniref:uncharacterized protein n=1 Tax=Diaporthe batatas TaxID=748121 RepID=UPI001D05111E|nr:uncharacterized protein KVR01_009230 [Diaporthe batatas]KAG8160966.1 hypothetical protein KVR01_009230 [Diaporthe batatas]